MRWAIKLGRLAGIDVYVHVTFTLLLVWIGIAQWIRTRDLQAVAIDLVFILSLFGCIVLHELGHALMARRYGIKTHDITLWPIGGVARLERMPDQPIQEFWVALAGPAVNVVIAAALLLGLSLSGGVGGLSEANLVQGGFLPRLALVNILVVAFNLLPAFPMDGGRILRAFFASRMPYDRATARAAAIGQGMALLFGFLGIMLTLPILFLVAFFVWIGAAQEASAAQERVGLEGIRVRDAMITDFQTLEADDPLSRPIELILAGSQHEFPVLENHGVIGVLTRKDLLVALSQHGRDRKVRQVLGPKFRTVTPDLLVTDLLHELRQDECQSWPVMSDGRLAGLLTAENLGEYIMIRSALRPSDDTRYLRRS
jgi:Zn-dependent protease/CBS domain-containing protein